MGAGQYNKRIQAAEFPAAYVLIGYIGGGQSTQVKDICKRQKLSQRYLEQIFRKLTKAGLLKSKRGRQGGYTLSKDPSEITVLDIINAAQGPIVPVACLNEKKRNCEVFLGFAKDSALRAEAGILYVLSQLSNEGHVYYPREGLLEKSCEILGVEQKIISEAPVQSGEPEENRY